MESVKVNFLSYRYRVDKRTIFGMRGLWGHVEIPIVTEAKTILCKPRVIQTGHWPPLQSTLGLIKWEVLIVTIV